MHLSTKFRRRATTDWTLTQHPGVERDLTRIDSSKNLLSVALVFLGLLQDPRPVGYIKLHGLKQVWYRVVVGNYRVVYQVDDGAKAIYIALVADRKQVYPQLNRRFKNATLQYRGHRYRIAQENPDFLQDFDEMLEVACADGTWNYDPYFHGMANGMIFVRSLLTDQEPQYLEAPDHWLADYMAPGRVTTAQVNQRDRYAKGFHAARAWAAPLFRHADKAHVAVRLSQQDQDKHYYHGTPTETAARSIAANGIVPPVLPKKKNFTTPVEDKVYLTSNIAYAQIYALGADAAGDSSGWFIKRGEPYGYVFVVQGHDLQDVQPDEDSIGKILGERAPDWLLALARKHVAPARLQRVMEGYVAYQASVGKQLLRYMTDQQKQELLNLGAHVAHGGVVHPSECWRLDKRRAVEMKRDGSNFFEIAEPWRFSINKSHTASVQDLRDRMGQLLRGPLDPTDRKSFVDWFAQQYPQVMMATTPRGGKQVKQEADWLIRLLRGPADEPGIWYKWSVTSADVLARWSRLEPLVDDLDRLFGGSNVPVQFQGVHALYLNPKGLASATFNQLVTMMDQLFGSITGWRARALDGLKVAFVGPQDMRGTSAGKYQSSTDTLMVKATPAVLARRSGQYGSPDYILVHELGHRYDRLFGTGGQNFDRNPWYTTEYSRSESLGGSESFAELFALGHFGIREVRANSFGDRLDRFESVMQGAEVKPRRPELPEHLRRFVDR